MLWFDVEKGYITTATPIATISEWLWFDVEKGDITTTASCLSSLTRLWFDVEKGYITTRRRNYKCRESCGLM